MLLSKNVSPEGKFTHSFYNASYVYFLRNFIKCFYSKNISRKVIRSIEKAMGDFNKDVLNFELQDPISASSNALYKVEGYTHRLDFLSFAKQISENDDDFDEYILNSENVDRFGEIDEEKNEEANKDNYKTKSRMLISFMKLLSEYQESSILKAHFELISKDCPSSKHVVISISGLASERSHLTEKWEKHIQDNPSLTVYAYRWKTKGMMPTLSSFVPKLSSLLDIGALFSKTYLAYKVIKVPFDYRQRFIDCWEMSKLYGKILAHALMLQFPFTNQSVSLFGFALGGQVLYSCLEELHHKKAYNIVYNVYFVGAAVDSGDLDKWAKVLSVVRGTVYNYYSYGDKTLHLYRTVTFKTPIGITTLMDFENREKVAKSKPAEIEKLDKARENLRIVNINASNPPAEVLKYKDDFDRMLAAVDFQK